MKNSSRSLFLFCTIVLLVFSEMPYLTVFIRFFRCFSVSLFFSVIIQIHNGVAKKDRHGDAADVLLSTIYSFGATGFDANQALNAMVDQANKKVSYDDLRLNLSSYLSNGYIGYNESTPSKNAASISMEYYQNDFSIAWLAKKLGNNTIYNEYINRANMWTNMFDSSTKLIRPRNTDGTWYSPFDVSSGDYFYEGSAIQYTWNIGWNFKDLVTSIGGTQAAISRMDNYFTNLNAGDNTEYFWMGNQPGYAHPLLYNWVGQPYKSQDLVRRILNDYFTNSKNGVPGEEDYGAMSSWYVLNAMGIFPAIYGTDALIFSAPLFPSIKINHESGSVININASGATHDTQYIQSMTVNGANYTKPWIWFNDIKNGATINVSVSTTENTSWGTNASDAPPSFGSVSATPTPTPALMPTPTPEPGATRFFPSDDAYVRGGANSVNNYGSESLLEVKEGSYSNFFRKSYLKFDLSSAGLSNISSAKLKLYANSLDGTYTVTAYGADDSWDESTITWDNAPNPGSSIATASVSTEGNYYEWDITSYVSNELSSDKVITIVLDDSSATNVHGKFNSKEASNYIPMLDVIGSGGATPTPTPVPVTTLHYPTDDAYVRGGANSTTNYGSQTLIEVKQGSYADYFRKAYFKFDLSSTGLSNVSSAKLKLYCNSIDGTYLITAYSADDRWDESTITWDNAPVLGSSITTSSISAAGQYYELDVTSYVNNQLDGDDVVTIALYDASTSNIHGKFNSKEATSNGPILEIVQ